MRNSSSGMTEDGGPAPKPLVPNSPPGGNGTPHHHSSPKSARLPLLQNSIRQPRGCVRRHLTSLRTILVVFLIFCVVSCTALAWAINATVAAKNAADLAEKVTRLHLQRTRAFIFSELASSLYFTRSDKEWIQFHNITTPSDMLNVLVPRFMDRLLDRPHTHVTVFGHINDLFVSLIVLSPGTTSEVWTLHTSLNRTDPIHSQPITPFLNGSYAWLGRETTSVGPYRVTLKSYFIDALREVSFVPIYYSGATSIPYLLATVRVFDGKSEQVIGNGVRTDSFSQTLRVNLTEGARFYIVERSKRFALLAASHGNIQVVVQGQAVPITPLESTDVVVRDSAIKLLSQYHQWSSVPSQVIYRLGDGEDYFVLTETVIGDGLDYVLVQAAPINVILRDVNRATMNTIIICSILVFIDFVVALVLSLNLARPLDRMHKDMVNLAQLNFASLSTSRRKERKTRINQLMNMERAFQKLQNGVQSFSKYVPLELLRWLLAEDQRVGPFMEPRRVTVLFCDIVNFASFCDRGNSQELLFFMTEYFNCVTQAIGQHNGTIDKYIGDCVMAIWNAPRPDPHHERKAIHSVFKIQEGLRGLQDQLRHLLAAEKKFQFRLGVNTDVVMAGSFGSSVRLAYTCVGSGVNLASRLQSLTLETGTSCLVSRNTAEAVSDVVFRYIGSTRVVGSAVLVKIYEPLCLIKSLESDSGSVLMTVSPHTNPLESARFSTEMLPDSNNIFVFGLYTPFGQLCDYADLYSQAVSLLEMGNVSTAQQLITSRLINRFPLDRAISILSDRVMTKRNEVELKSSPSGRQTPRWDFTIIQASK